MKELSIFLHSLWTIIFLSCAAIQSPSGGPKDVTPPEIIKIMPPNGSVNIKNKTIEITFSEYLDESSIDKSLRIFPKPINPFTINLKNPKLIIFLNDTLLNNQTYIVSINRNLSDERKVKLEQELQFAFSTGNKIDKGLIGGKVHYKGSASVGLWKIHLEQDQNFFYKRSPDYVTDASDNGDFTFNYLSKGIYKLVCVDKSISGVPLIPDKMIYGLSSRELLEIGDQDSLIRLNIKIPESFHENKIEKATMISKGFGQITFSKSIKHWEKLLLIEFFNEDSVKINLELFKDLISDNVLNFDLAEQDLEFLDINYTSLKKNYKFQKDVGKIRVYPYSKLDSVNLSILEPSENYIHNIESDSIIPLKIIFSDLILKEFDGDNLTLMRDSTAISFNLTINSPLGINLVPESNWEENSSYSLIMKNSFIKPLYVNSLTDSTIKLNFKTSKFKKFGNLMGSIENVPYNSIHLELISLKNPEKKYKTKANSKGLFRLSKIEEGNYRLGAFSDEDSNSIYTNGSLYPYRPAEWFNFYEDTIKIRGNWDLELDNIKIGVVE